MILLLSMPIFSKAQDTLSVVRREQSSGKAMLYSAVVPGLGQVYNRKYWKVPLIYGGGLLLVSSAISNAKLYNEYLGAYRARTDNNPATTDAYGVYTTDGLILIKDNYKRNRDVSIIGTVFLYAINIVDAYVDAELFDFNVNDDLKASIMPTNQVIAQGVLIPSLSLKLHF